MPRSWLHQLAQAAIGRIGIACIQDIADLVDRHAHRGLTFRREVHTARLRQGGRAGKGGRAEIANGRAVPVADVEASPGLVQGNAVGPGNPRQCLAPPSSVRVSVAAFQE